MLAILRTGASVILCSDNSLNLYVLRPKPYAYKVNQSNFQGWATTRGGCPHLRFTSGLQEKKDCNKGLSGEGNCPLEASLDPA